MADPKPLVLLIDEIDSLVGDTLLSVLRQLRASYKQRPEGFPQSVVSCGVRDIHDYRIRSSSGEVIAGGSPFYARDLGLVAQGSPPRIANPIYAEVVPRELGYVLRDSLDQDLIRYVDPGGGLNVDKLLGAFQPFFRAHSEHWLERFEYREAGP